MGAIGIFLILAVIIVAVHSGKDYYKILGVKKNAKEAELKKAYRKLGLLLTSYHRSFSN